jgi:predicted CXXCH cytochrome family protein
MQPAEGDHPAAYKTPKKCEDCHAGAGAYGAFVPSEHMYGAANAIVTATRSTIFPVTGSCLFCHDADKTYGGNLMVLMNQDPDIGTFDIDLDGRLGGPGSPYHYTNVLVDKATSPYTHNVFDTSTDAGCLFCHDTAVNGAQWGGAVQLPPAHPRQNCYTCHGDVRATDFHNPMSAPGAGPDCLLCHGTGGAAPATIDSAAMGSGAHANLNAFALGTAGLISTGAANPNAPCWACHGEGYQPAEGGHPARYRNPRICEDCHTGAGAFAAPVVTQHYKGASINVTSTTSATKLVTGSCLVCHTLANGMVLPNTDVDTGTSDADDNGIVGGPDSAYHYPVYVTRLSETPYGHNVLNTVEGPGCPSCHASSEGERWAAATQLTLPGYDPTIYTTSVSCYPCHGDVSGRDFHETGTVDPEKAKEWLGFTSAGIAYNTFRILPAVADPSIKVNLVPKRNKSESGGKNYGYEVPYVGVVDGFYGSFRQFMSQKSIWGIPVWLFLVLIILIPTILIPTLLLIAYLVRKLYRGAEKEGGEIDEKKEEGRRLIILVLWMITVNGLVLVALLMFLGMYNPERSLTKTVKCLSCHDNQLAGAMNAKFKHAPFKSERCTDCHKAIICNDKEKAVLKEGVEKLCFGCHQSTQLELKMNSRHEPFEKKKCLDCHDPHGSDNKEYIKKPLADLCVSCHKDPKTNATIRHQPVARNGCADCHEPHASNEPHRTILPVGELCDTCHAKLAMAGPAGSVSHLPFADKRCTDCHDPHGGSVAKLLITEQTDLCGKCHVGLTKEMSASVQHQPFREGKCDDCHAPHLAPTAGLMKADTETVCRSCHTVADPDFAKVVHHFLENADITCLNCHQPHVGENSHLMIDKL